MSTIAKLAVSVGARLGAVIAMALASEGCSVLGTWREPVNPPSRVVQRVMDSLDGQGNVKTFVSQSPLTDIAKITDRQFYRTVIQAASGPIWRSAARSFLSCCFTAKPRHGCDGDCVSPSSESTAFRAWLPCLFQALCTPVQNAYSGHRLSCLTISPIVEGKVLVLGLSSAYTVAK